MWGLAIGLLAAAGAAAVAVVVEQSGVRLVGSARDYFAGRLGQREYDRRRDLSMSGAIEDWLISYETRAGRSDSLPRFESNGHARTLGVYSPEAWHTTSALETSVVRPVRPVEEQPAHPTKMLVPPRTVRQHMRRTGHEIWDGPSLTTRNLPVAADTPLTPFESSYWIISPQMIQLEEEAFRCAGSGAKPSVRKSLENEFSTTERGVGGTVAFVIHEIGEEPKVLLHRRSLTVATNPGMICTIPTYVMENNSAGRKSELDVVAWNVLRELLEEAFEQRQLEQSSIRVDLDWFLSNGIGERLRELIDNRSLLFYHLGWFLSLTNGLVDAMTLAYLRCDADDVSWLRSQMRGNALEVDDGYNSLWLIDLFSNELSELCLSRSFHAGCALAVKQARLVLRDLAV